MTAEHRLMHIVRQRAILGGKIAKYVARYDRLTEQLRRIHPTCDYGEDGKCKVCWAKRPPLPVEVHPCMFCKKPAGNQVGNQWVCAECNKPIPEAEKFYCPCAGSCHISKSPCSASCVQHHQEWLKVNCPKCGKPLCPCDDPEEPHCSDSKCGWTAPPEEPQLPSEEEE